MKSTLRTVPLAAIRTDGGTRIRDGVDAAHVAELRAMYEDGVEVDPILVVIDAANIHWLADGEHRYDAMRGLEMTSAEVSVVIGTLDDAKLLACKSNKHGKSFTSGEKKRAILVAMRTERGRAMGLRELARHCGVSAAWASEVIGPADGCSPTNTSAATTSAVAVPRVAPRPHVAAIWMRVDAALTDDPKRPDSHIARAVGCSRQVVVHRRKDLGIPQLTRSESMRAVESAVTARADAEATLTAHPTWSNRQVSEKTGVSPKVVSEVRSSLGIPGTRDAAKSAPPRRGGDCRDAAEVLPARPPPGVDSAVVETLRRLESLTAAQREAVLASAADRWPTAAPSKAEPVGPAPEPLPAGDTWQRAKAILSEHVDDALEAVDEPERQRILGRCMGDIKAALSDLRAEVQRRVRNGASGLADVQAAATRAAVTEACLVLGLPGPRRGKPIDIEAANKARKKLGRAYHPDANGGSEENRAQFEAVMQSYRTIENYNERLNNAGSSNGALNGSHVDAH